MTYPKTVLTKPVRKGINFFLITVFFVLSPLLLLYTAGYRYDWENKRILETGVISIDEIEPKEVVLNIGTQTLTKKIPIRLTNRAPGIYHIEISKPGFKTWSKDIAVKSKETTYLKHLSLIKDNLPVPFFEEKLEVKSIYPSENGRHLILETRHETDLNVHLELLDTETRIKTELLTLPEKDSYTVSWSPNNSLVAIFKKNGEKTDLTLLDAYQPENKQFYSLEFGPWLENFQWQKDRNSLITQDGASLLEFTLEKFRRIKQIPKNSLWYLDDKDLVWLLDQNSATIKDSTGDEKNSVAILNSQEYTSILHMDGNMILIQSKQGLVIVKINNENNSSNLIHTNKIKYNPNNKSWLAWSDWEVWSIDNKGETSLITRTGDTIKDVSPLNQFGVIVIANSIKLEANDPNYSIIQNLYSGKVNQISVNKKKKVLYFLGEVGGKEGLFELEF